MATGEPSSFGWFPGASVGTGDGEDVDAVGVAVDFAVGFSVVAGELVGVGVPVGVNSKCVTFATYRALHRPPGDADVARVVLARP